MSRDAANFNAGGVLVDRMLSYVARQSSGEQTKEGDRQLDEARKLIEVNQPVIDPGDLQTVEDKIAHVREMKLGLDSKWGPSKLLHARVYRKYADSVYHHAKVVPPCQSSRLSHYSFCSRYQTGPTMRKDDNVNEHSLYPRQTCRTVIV
jgi:hypothetical protein